MPVVDRGHPGILILEGVQPGLSRETVPRRRDGDRENFTAFDPPEVARFTPKRTESILRAVTHALTLTRQAQEFRVFDARDWRLVDGHPEVKRWRTMKDVPARPGPRSPRH